MSRSEVAVKLFARKVGENGAVLAVNTTVLAVVAPGDGTPLDGARASNVRVLRTDAEASLLDRAVAACAEAGHTAAPYLLHDADPLAAVADAWARRFDGTGVAGDLEIAVAATLSRWRAQTLDLPDYYLVADPEALGATERHWYLGVLATAAPARVVALRPATPIVDQLAGLATGPWWPSLDRLLADIDRLVPDQVRPVAGTGERPGLIRL
jgi:hypothetical protein